MTTKQLDKIQPSIAIIGGGIAGSTSAIHFSELGYQVTLLEKGPSLVNGPPICHLHAGGNLYRDIPEEQCLELLRQSIDTVRLFPHSLNIRPTVIAVPLTDNGSPGELLPRLKVISESYKDLVELDPLNKVLGEPEQYYKLYSKAELIELAKQQQSNTPLSLDDWCIPFAQYADLDALKYPVVMVQEYGLSVFRLSATAQLSLRQLDNCNVLTDSKLISVEQNDSLNENAWCLNYRDAQNIIQTLNVDYLINASGFETGLVDDIVGSKQERLVEFKAAYVSQWTKCNAEWPEVIFHGPRGTPQGMAQLTPYADGYFQLHGMTEGITLFEDGLVASCDVSSQPKLPQRLIKKIVSGWTPEQLEERTTAAISHMSQFVPSFEQAEVGGKPLFGAQQIPGSDPSLRAADVSFCGERYARIEMVKASSALEAATKIHTQWFAQDDSEATDIAKNIESTHSVTLSLNLSQVLQHALELTEQRGYPAALAKVSGIAHSEPVT